jgi:hypothetical protein
MGNNKNQQGPALPNEKDKDTGKHDPIKEGKKAIDAKKIADNQSAAEADKKEKRDAEQWRNEG